MVTARPLDWEMPTWSLPTKPSEFKSRLIKLIDMMQTIGGSEINSITGLCIHIFAQQKEVHQYQLAIMLEKIIYWISRMNKANYTIYRTDEEWIGDIGLSRYKLRKLRDKLAPVVNCANKHNQSRTKIMHYQLDGEALLSAIAKVYGKSESYIRGVLFVRSVESPKLKNPDFKPSGTKTLKPDFKVLGRNTSKSLTTLPSNNSSKEELTKTTTHAAAVDEKKSLGDKNLVGFPEKVNATDDSEQVEALVGAGLWRKVARQHDWLPITTIQSMIEQAQAKKKRGDLRENVGNYLNGALQKHADYLREEYKRAIAHGQELSLIDFALQHEQIQSHNKSEFAGLTWSDLATD